MTTLVYVAGPMTKDPTGGLRAACFAGDQLLRAGLTPILPQLSWQWDFISPKTWEEWIAYDLPLLSRCDVLLRLPGESKGADMEVEEAKRLGIPVFHDIAELIAHTNT